MTDLGMPVHFKLLSLKLSLKHFKELQKMINNLPGSSDSATVIEGSSVIFA